MGDNIEFDKLARPLEISLAIWKKSQQATIDTKAKNKSAAVNKDCGTIATTEEEAAAATKEVEADDEKENTE
jgi:hypothetical protein